MNQTSFRFRVHGERLAIARLLNTDPLPSWATGAFVTISRTCDELSIVCAQGAVPSHVKHERNKIALGIEGVIPMTTLGLLARLCAGLTKASVPVFVISTYDTDWLIVSAEYFTAAKTALEEQGHRVLGSLPLD